MSKDDCVGDGGEWWGLWLWRVHSPSVGTVLQLLLSSGPTCRQNPAILCEISQVLNASAKTKPKHTAIQIKQADGWV